MPTKKLDPQARKDYVWDFGEWLPDGDSISTADLLPEAGITFDGQELIASPTSGASAAAVRAWVEWNNPTMPEDGSLPRLGITCRIETAQGRRDDKTMHFLYFEG
jgi:hypothetical protein